MNWYTPTSTSGQPLIVDEETGKTIAVCYTSQRDARIIANAPRMLELLRKVEQYNPDVVQLLIDIEE